MTVRELYDNAVKEGIADCEIEVPKLMGYVCSDSNWEEEYEHVPVNIIKKTGDNSICLDSNYFNM